MDCVNGRSHHDITHQLMKSSYETFRYFAILKGELGEHELPSIPSKPPFLSPTVDWMTCFIQCDLKQAVEPINA